MTFTTEAFYYDWTGVINAPMKFVDNTVKREWVDEYGHMNMAHYLTLCDQANWAFWNWINHPSQQIEEREGHEYVIVENHVHYMGELSASSPVSVTTQLLAFDDKRYILFHHVWDMRDNSLSATNEVKFLGFNLKTRGVEAWKSPVLQRLEEIALKQQHLSIPSQAGLGIKLKQ